MMAALAKLVVRRRRAVVALWVALLIVGGTVASAAFDVLSLSSASSTGSG